MRKFIALLLVAVLLSGCTGSFRLTNKVYNFHRSMNDKWMDELAFVVMAYLPVYAIAILGDAVIFNSIEFWTGNNPIQAKASDDSVKIARAGDLKAVMLRGADDTVRVVAYRQDKEVTSFVLAKSDENVAIKDKNGDIVYYSKMGPDGSISLYDKDNSLVRTFSKDQVQLAKDRHSTQNLFAKL